MTPFDRFVLAVTLIFVLAWLAKFLGWTSPLAGLVSFFFYVVAATYLLFRLVTFSRRRLLWSLRNRLIVAYLFIAVVPVLLLALMAGLTSLLIYQQLAAYLLYEDLHLRMDRLAARADDLAAALSSQPGANQSASAEVPTVQAFLVSAQREFPGVEWNLKHAQPLLERHGGPGKDRFVGLVQEEDRVWLMAVVSRKTQSGSASAGLSVPFEAELLERVAPDLGPVQVSITRPAKENETGDSVRVLGDLRFVTLRTITTRSRELPARSSWIDVAVPVVSRLEAVPIGPDGAGKQTFAFFASLSSRPSLLNHRLFAAPGEAASLYAKLLIAIGIVFLILEGAALITGISLSRSITRAVDELYDATRHVQEGDFSHRVHVEREDQLGVLGDSFNAMTSSISTLIEEQRQRQRLENELSIAREVQSQLFPQTLPSVPGIELAAFCRAARVVSGDYYDFIPLGLHRVAMVIADISGKGISAALLMASLQAALRSQLLVEDGISARTSDLVSRLNRHLFLNTSDDRYATLFYAVYDCQARVLHYTNAGHLPPLLLSGNEVKKLEEGGMVVGLFDDVVYEQGTIQIEPGSLLIAYSDGLSEPENVYGEQFGHRRLREEAIRQRQVPPQRMAEHLVAAAEEWAPTPEQADDMTVIVAKLS